MLSVAIIDVLGLTYDGETLSKRGLGGSESAVILMSKELAKLGFKVTVFNNCIDSHAREGVFDGVEYVDHTRLDSPNNYTADIVIGSRTTVPFSFPQHWEHWKQFGYICSRYQQLVQNAKYKALWMHDTFCGGDEILEDLLLAGNIDEIFTLSDFHMAYVTNCHHGGKRRNFEVLKNKVFITRNGIVKYIDQVDVAAKDRNLFVYNASATKGLVPLLERIWPLVKHNIPAAQLKVVGGYYRFRDNAEPDAQEKTVRAYASDPKYAQMGVEFTGIIKQSEIADLLSRASFMIMPGAFPETFGISTLESLYYNTPVLCSRFGALEETAVNLACYQLDYAVEPNGLFPEINVETQSQKFAAMTIAAYNNTYLHQQKMYACNQIRDICTWDTVALQWKQHFYKKLGHFLPVNEYRQVADINTKVHRVFGRKFSNIEEWVTPPHAHQQRIAVISPFYNSASYLRKCIESVAAQNYDNYHHYLIDDASTDNSVDTIMQVMQDLPDELDGKFTLIRNDKNVGAVYNQVKVIRDLHDEDIVILLDGDDWLFNDPDIFHYYNNLYHDNTEFSYGSCWSVVDNIPLISQTYPKHVRDSKNYRNHHFNWIMPYTHLRTFKKRLINNVDDTMFQDNEGNWFKAGGDGSLFYSILEQADPNKVKVVSRVVYNYNDTNPINDYKVNGDEQTRNARSIIKMKDGPTFTIPEPPSGPIPPRTTPRKPALEILKELGISIANPTGLTATVDPVVEPQSVSVAPARKKKILIAIPTARNIEVDTFKSIYDLEIPDGYETDFRYTFGYRVDQVRNLIAHWAANEYDYLFSVDSDIVFPKDTLKKMLSHDKDIVSGLYIQRIPGTHALEIYLPNQWGGMNRAELDQLPDNALIPIGGCGFGCVLVKSEVFRAVGHPQFEYHVALDHKDTVSEDTDFCAKATRKGFKIFADTSIRCDHVGAAIFRVGYVTGHGNFESKKKNPQ